MKRMVIVIDAEEGSEVRREDVIDTLSEVFRLDGVDGVSIYDGAEWTVSKKIPVFSVEQVSKLFKNRSAEITPTGKENI
ncbi:MAG: hypothetical protein IJ002_03050 [Clostridia bacterium]|nr:hypothetical protein [Clostridia bacterium]MBQ8836469.1 hypothetical protein [Clostridia bacterium]